MAGVFQLRGSVKTYDWGKLGLGSMVAQLYKSAFEDFEFKDDSPYSELWMGTHPSGMSHISILNELPLSKWIHEHPDSLGAKIRERFGDDGLPFLFKVLSIRKPLSIQAHPDKEMAKKLHEKFSDRYPDDNHKPEIAIALSNFQALCGFRPISEIKAFVTELQQLQAILGDDVVALFLDSPDDESILKTVFTKFITQREGEFQEHLADLVQYLKNCSSLSDLCKSVKNIFLGIHQVFPGDIGCLCTFFLNHIALQPGQAIFLAANEPHAYLEGDCIECMACSDNVVRAGLTPKFKDVNTLCNILTYKCKTAEENMFQPAIDDSDTCEKIYDPPVPEFTIAKIEICSSESIYNLKTLDSASLLVIIEGEAVLYSSDLLCCSELFVKAGTVLFISSSSNVELHISSSKILMFRAFCT